LINHSFWFLKVIKDYVYNNKRILGQFAFMCIGPSVFFKLFIFGCEGTFVNHVDILGCSLDPCNFIFDMVLE